MNKERTRELKRSAARNGLLPPIKTREYHLSHNSVSGDNESGSGGDIDLMEGWKKDKIKGSKGRPNYDDGEMGNGGSDDGDENVVRPPSVTAATTNINTKKRVKLNGKVADDCVAVVPRKLRSAIHKRSNGSPSPPVPSARSYKGINGLRMFKQSKVTDSLTKDEEEVIETLSVLSSIASDTKLNDNGIDRRLPDENVNTKAMDSIVISQDRTTKETEVQTTPIDLEAIGTSSCMESLETAKRARSSTAKDVFEHSGVDVIVQSSFRNIDLESTSVSVVDCQKSTPIYKSENLLQLSSGITISHQNSALLQIVPFDGKFQHTQLDVLPLKPEIRLSPALDSAPTRQEMKLSKERSQNVTCRQEAASDTWNMKPVKGAHGKLTESFSTKMEARFESACSAARPDLRGNDISTEKFVLDSACGRESWKKCATHVYISHLIRNHQNAEKNHQWSFPTFHIKLEGREPGAVAISKSTEWKNGLTKPSTSGSYSSTPDNRIDLRTGIQHNRRLHPDPKHPTISGVHSQPKPMVDFLSLSACGEHGTSGKTTESLGHLPVAYLHSLPPNHHMIPFSLPPGHYPSHYPEQLAAQQLPHYVGHPFYGLHIGGVSSLQQQHQHQQQMWQAHLTNSRQKIAPKWQNTSLVPCPIPSSSSMENQGVIQRSTNPHIRPQIFAVPFPVTTNKMKRHHQQTNPNRPGSFNQAGAILPEGSAQLQVLCSAQRL